ncbi:MAG: hypothetical protein GY765_28155 [bacterium]|nr:hypothetical protein [bacterium]
MKNKKRIDNTSLTVNALLTAMGIPATLPFVEKVLATHPDYPSILAISEAMHEWGVETEAAKGTVGDLRDIKFPAIAHLKNDKYVVLVGVSENQVEMISPTKGKVKVPIDKFSEMWSGIVLYVVRSKGAREKNYNRHRKEQFLHKLRRISIIPGFLIFLAGTFAACLPGDSPIATLVFPGVLKIAGLAACAVMFAGSTGNNNILSRVCNFKEKLDCQRVLNSPGGSILGISVVDMGLVYFAGGFLALLFSLLAGQTEQCLRILGFLNILVLPYTLFSLFYQAFVVRAWCLLCLFVQAIFWGEFYFLFPFLDFTSDFIGWTAILPTVFGFGLVLLSWLTLSPIISKYPTLKLRELEALRLQNHPDFIKVKLAEAENIDMGKFPFEVSIGEANAVVTLTLVLNPLCRHCGETLREMMALVEIGKGKIKGVVRFLVGGKADGAENSLDFDVACLVTGLAVAGGNTDAPGALEKWFAGAHSGTPRFFKSWQRRYTVPDDDTMEQARQLLKLQLKWAVKNNLNSTPMLFLQNLKLPDGTTFKNLKYFLIRKLHN